MTKRLWDLMKVERRERITSVGIVNFKKAQKRTEIRVAYCGEEKS